MENQRRQHIQKPSTLVLERFALGEITEEERERVCLWLQSQGESPDEFLRRIEEENSDILEIYPAEMMATRIIDDLQISAAYGGQNRHKRRWRMAGAGALVTICVLFFIIVSPSINNQSTNDIHKIHNNPITGTVDETIRFKGLSPQLRIWRQTLTGPQALSSGSHVNEGDILQLQYNGAGKTHGVIASMDGAGVVTLHFPDKEGDDTHLSEGIITLDHSYQLDDAPGFERFFFMVSNQPIDTTQILNKLEQIAESHAVNNSDNAKNSAVTLGESIEIIDILLEK